MQITRPLTALGTVLVTILTLAVALPPAAASASGAAITVSYEDLDLATPAGKATLDRRIARAAAQLCGTGCCRGVVLTAADAPVSPRSRAACASITPR